jgi:putative peptidoglycan lipid II flippase
MTTTSDAPGPSGARRRSRLSGRNAVLVGAGIMVSRLAGLGREVLIGRTLGARSAEADAFGAALRIPQVIQNLLGEGALSASFIPVYSRLLDEGDEREASRVAGAVLGLLAFLTGLLVLVAVVLARPLTAVLTFGFEGEKFDLTVALTRIMAGGIGFIVLGAWCLGVLNAHRRFFLSYVAPALWNIVIIGALVTGSVRGWSIGDIAHGAAWGVFFGGLAQFVVQIPSVIKLVPRLRPSLNKGHPGVAEVTRRFGPAVAGRGVVTLSSYVDLLLASFLATGAVATLDRVQVLYLLPISVFALSIAAADLPELSRELGQSALMTRRLAVGAERVALFLVFSAVAFIFGGRLIVSALFENGQEFLRDDAIVAWVVLGTYSLGLVPSGLSRLLQNACYVVGDVSGPARIAAFRVAFAAGAGLVLMFQFDRIAVIGSDLLSVGDLPAFGPVSSEARSSGDFARLGAVGLAVGSMLGAWIELSMLQARLRRHIGHAAPFRRALTRLLPATAAATVTMIVLGAIVWSAPALLATVAAVGTAGVVFLIVANRAGNIAARSLLRPLRRLLWGQPLR